MRHRVEVGRLGNELRPAAFDTAQLKHIVDEAEQDVARHPYLADRIFDRVGVRRVVGNDTREAENGVERRADVVRHIRQKIGFDLTGGFGLSGGDACLLKRKLKAFPVLRLDVLALALDNEEVRKRCHDDQTERLKRVNDRDRNDVAVDQNAHERDAGDEDRLE